MQHLNHVECFDDMHQPECRILARFDASATCNMSSIGWVVWGVDRCRPTGGSQSHRQMPTSPRPCYGC
jgi:hypothetical protein